jgi:hypothetical protein
MKTLTRFLILLGLLAAIGLIISACAPAPTPIPPPAVPATKAPEPTKVPASPTPVPPTAVPTPATKFPEKPVTLVVHASAGGGSDIFARTLAAAFEKEKIWSQPIAVENRAGGSGAVAFAYVFGKKGDPYFLLTAVTSFMTTPMLQAATVNFTYKDFTPIANFAFDEYMLMVKADSKDL